MTDLYDIGELQGPLLFCGGIYSNLEAFSAFETIIRKSGFRPENIIHTGDVVAYCADHSACVDKLRSLGWHAIKGNVEEQLARGGDDCGCGFEQASACSILADNWFADASAAISRDQRHWLQNLPHQLTFTCNKKRVRVVHGSLDNISRFIFASASDAVFEHQFALAGADIIIAGHCGIPFTRQLGDKIWHNTGALGMPANDGTARVWYSQMQVQNGDINFSHLPVTYDAKTAAAKMRQAGLPQGYANALETGLWPSLDILPPPEAAATGTPLHIEQS